MLSTLSIFSKIKFSTNKILVENHGLRENLLFSLECVPALTKTSRGKWDASSKWLLQKPFPEARVPTQRP